MSTPSFSQTAARAGSDAWSTSPILLAQDSRTPASALQHAQAELPSPAEEDAHAPPAPSPTWQGRGFMLSMTTYGAVDADHVRDILDFSDDMDSLHNGEFLMKRVDDLERAVEEKKCVALPTLEDTVCCGICYELMWRPVSIVECGHVYCEECVYKWFNCLLELFRRPLEHRTYNPSRSVPYISHSIIKWMPVRAQKFILKMNQRARPDYMCPGCRASVLQCPTVLWHLGDLVERVALMRGDKDPYQPQGTLHGRERQKEDWSYLFGLYGV